MLKTLQKKHLTELSNFITVAITDDWAWAHFVHHQTDIIWRAEVKVLLTTLLTFSVTKLLWISINVLVDSQTTSYPWHEVLVLV